MKRTKRAGGRQAGGAAAFFNANMGQRGRLPHAIMVLHIMLCNTSVHPSIHTQPPPEQKHTILGSTARTTSKRTQANDHKHRTEADICLRLVKCHDSVFSKELLQSIEFFVKANSLGLSRFDLLVDSDSSLFEVSHFCLRPLLTHWSSLHRLHRFHRFHRFLATKRTQVF